jgi:SH3-like domain-containing protein
MYLHILFYLCVLCVGVLNFGFMRKFLFCYTFLLMLLFSLCYGASIILALQSNTIVDSNKNNFNAVEDIPKVQHKINDEGRKERANIRKTDSGTKGLVDGGKSGEMDKKTFPYFAVLKSNDVNLRYGPGSKYPIKYNFCCKGYPVQVLAEFDTWKLVRDVNNKRAWVRSIMLTTLRKHVLVVSCDIVDVGHDKESNNTLKNKSFGPNQKDSQDKNNKGVECVQKENLEDSKHVFLLRLPNLFSSAIAKMEKGLIARVLKCQEQFCRVEASKGLSGWIHKRNMWGM